MKLEGKIFITGGSGTLGRAILERAKREEWDAEFTVFSRDPVKQHRIKADFPDTNFVIGDVADYRSLENAVMGHDIVIHAAAMKHIPEGERNPIYMYEVNVTGSQNVAVASFHAKVKQLIGISTDKACHPVNAYGCTKMMMERMFQEYAVLETPTYHLVRYGNVIGSTGSVAQVWREMLEEHGKVWATDAKMTRYWLTPDDAVSWILMSLDRPSGTITVPVLKSLSMAKFAKYTLPKDAKVTYEGLRPGEKMHEELLTAEESVRAYHVHNSDLRMSWVDLYPPGCEEMDVMEYVFGSDTAKRLTKEELLEMIGE